jgi:hypothetical protein
MGSWYAVAIVQVATRLVQVARWMDAKHPSLTLQALHTPSGMLRAVVGFVPRVPLMLWLLILTGLAVVGLMALFIVFCDRL